MERQSRKERARQLDCIYDEEQKAPPAERTKEIFKRKAYQTKNSDFAKNEANGGKCKNCTYFGRAGDAPETVAMDCMWQQSENEDYEGLPCEESR